MEAGPNARTLIRWSGALAACGALIFVAAVFVLAIALWHHSLISGYGPTCIFAPPALTACFVVSSIVVLVASTFVRHIADHRLVALAKRLSLVAIISTVAGWLIVGVLVLWIAHR